MVSVFTRFKVNPRLNKLFFVTRLRGGVGVAGVATPSLEFRQRTPYELGFDINRQALISMSLSLAFQRDRKKNRKGIATTPLVRRGLIQCRHSQLSTSSAYFDLILSNLGVLWNLPRFLFYFIIIASNFDQCYMELSSSVIRFF